MPARANNFAKQKYLNGKREAPARLFSPRGRPAIIIPEKTQMSV